MLFSVKIKMANDLPDRSLRPAHTDPLSLDKARTMTTTSVWQEKKNFAIALLAIAMPDKLRASEFELKR